MPLLPGDPAPDFSARSTVNPKFEFDTVAGRYIVLSFFGSAGREDSQRVLAGIDGQRPRFDNRNATFFGVSVDPDDERTGRIKQEWPGIMYFWDFDRAISRLYGADASGPSSSDYVRHALILDPSLRVLAYLPFGDDPEGHVAQVLGLLDKLTPVSKLGGFAPVLVVPHVFEVEFCRKLIGLYEADGGHESGFMRDVGGKTVQLMDPNHKRRRDYELTDSEVIRAAQQRLHRRLVPEIRKAFQFQATRIERHLVACYDAEAGGHFKAHRDNTTKGTAHRRFAVTINLNAEEFEGGNLWFPEFGPRAYRAPTGGAVVFSCSLLHEATPVTKGRRYAFLPFLYDEAAAKVREENLKFVAAR